MTTSEPANEMQVRDGKKSAAENDRSIATKASESARETLEQTGEKAKDFAQQIKDGAQTAGQAAKQIASDSIESIRNAADEQKTAGAEAVASLARNASKAAGGVEAASSVAADAIRKSASAVERTANEVRDTDLNDLVQAVHGYGQKNPMMLLAAGVVGGILLGRIFSTSGPRS